MTGLLVSVRSAEEADAALAGGAAVIDVKEPGRGPLGAADIEVVREVINRVGQRAPVSAALGELIDAGASDLRRLPPGLRFAKLGLAGCAAIEVWPERWQTAMSCLDPAISPVAVAYADRSAARAPGLPRVLTFAREARCTTLLIDTFDKSSGSLLDILDIRRLGTFMGAARKAGLAVVLAGNLRLAHIEQIRRLKPDLVGVRGAVCRGGRAGTVCADLVAEFASALGGRRPQVATPNSRLHTVRQ